MDALVPVEAWAAPAPDADPAPAPDPASAPALAAARTTAPATALPPAPTQTPAPTPALVASNACKRCAAPTCAEATPAPYELLQLVTLSLDSEAKRTWRLVSKATCHAVYESTTGLNLPEGRYEAESITALPLQLLAKCGGLKRLLCGEARELESIHGLPRGLEVLEISGEAIADLSPLRRCCGLQQLTVQSMYNWGHILATPAALYTAGGWTELCSALQCMPRLQRLDLNCCFGQDVKAMQILAPALETLTEMQHLTIRVSSSSRGLKAVTSEEGARALASALAPLTRLQHLDLSRMGLNAAGASTLTPSLGCLAGLQKLNLSDNSLGPEGALALAPALAALTALQHLDLGSNEFGPDGSKSLAPALQALSNLQVLDLSWNDMDDEAAQVLAPILLSITSLRSLDCSRNHMLNGRKALAPLINVAGLVVDMGEQY